MLEANEMKFIIANEDGSMIACYVDYESAEIDAKDLSASEDNKDKKFHIYELTSSAKLGETIVQKTYEVKLTLPLPPEEEPEETKEESKEEDKPSEESGEKEEKEEKEETDKPDEKK
jgi:hypothetical protein